MNLQSWMIPSDLAPGDAKSLQRDWSDIELHRIGNTSDPHFDIAFGALWSEFGVIGEVEQADVLGLRMLWDPSQVIDGCSMRYRMMLVTSNGKFAAVRDHTAIVLEDEPGAVVHLSHNLVAPEWRRTGLAGWLRALPITTARSVLSAQSRPADSPITLVGEMEHPDSSDQATLVRLAAYEKAGCKKIDPARVGYLQPDFRAHHEIDMGGGPQPIPLCLIIRKVGREHEEHVTGSEVRRIARSLYKMYGTGFRAKDMDVVHASLENYPAPEEKIPLLPPTAL
ncbi:MAG: hypothetical protein NTV93_01200 [Verrucomicrobia bacterium]|nr:hypothetical protein [Verrucomicrobiota bacterium]